jgi:hypothetical protein
MPSMLQGGRKSQWQRPNGTIRFLSDWRQVQQGGIERGGRLRIDYDKGRSPRCFTNWRGAEFGEIVASVRFHPRGSVLAPVRSSENPPGVVIGHVPSIAAPMAKGNRT